MKSFLIIFCFLFVLPVFANNFCDRTNTEIKELLLNENSRLSFKNNGGLFNGGVCWWHSRLQRSSIYLVQFAPERSIPTEDEVWDILKSLRSMNKVVMIPGFKDFSSFSLAYKPQIQQLLNQWQARDGFINQQWVRGISGRSSLQPAQLKKQMDYIFNFFQESPLPVWLMAQVKGVTAHAFLLLEMFPLQNGYHLRVIDSNKPLITRDIFYQHGDTNLTLDDRKYTFIPYTGFQKDFKQIGLAIKSHCPNYKLELAVGTKVHQGQLEPK
jgi:hypothetical protein